MGTQTLKTTDFEITIETRKYHIDAVEWTFDSNGRRTNCTVQDEYLNCGEGSTLEEAVLDFVRNRMEDANLADVALGLEKNE